MQRPKMGRPTREKSASMHVLGIRLTGDELVIYTRAAKQAHKTISEYVRHVVALHLGHKL